MPKIHFTGNPKIPHDKAEEWKDYLKGSIHEVSNDEAERWVRRGIAEIVTTRQANLILKEEEKVEELKAPEPKASETKAPESKLSQTTISNIGSVSSQGTTSATLGTVSSSSSKQS